MGNSQKQHYISRPCLPGRAILTCASVAQLVQNTFSQTGSSGRQLEEVGGLRVLELVEVLLLELAAQSGEPLEHITAEV